MEKEVKRYSSIIFGTFFFGIIINFIILIRLDSNIDCGRSFSGATCTPYPFLLFLSLFLGWIVSIIIIKLDNKKKIIEKKLFNKILSNKRTINYLNWRSQNRSDIEKEERYKIFYERLKKEDFLEELFKKSDKEAGEFFLEVEKKSNNIYKIEFGVQYFLQHNEDKGCYGGESVEAEVTYDKNDLVVSVDKETINLFGG